MRCVFNCFVDEELLTPMCYNGLCLQESTPGVKRSILFQLCSIRILSNHTKQAKPNQTKPNPTEVFDMPLQQYTIPGLGGAEQQVEEVPPPQVEQPVIPLLSYQDITSINQILRPEQVAGLTLHNDHPENRLVYVFIANILGESHDHITQFNQPMTNRQLESFLERVNHYLNTVDEHDVLVTIMYGEWTPPRAIYEQHVSNVRERLFMARHAILANDPQLGMSILYNHTLRYDQVPIYRNNEQPVDNHDTFGPDVNTQPNERFLLLDSASRRRRFIIRPDRVQDLVMQVYVNRGQRPDGHLEDVPSEILRGDSNQTTRAYHALANENRFVADINQIVNLAGNSTRQDLHNTLIHWINLWTQRDQNREFRHPDLPAPSLVGSIHFHRTATPVTMMAILSAKSQKVRNAHVAAGKVLPQRIRDFITANPANIEAGSATLDEESLRIFVGLVEG